MKAAYGVGQEAVKNARWLLPVVFVVVGLVAAIHSYLKHDVPGIIAAVVVWSAAAIIVWHRKRF